MFIANDLLGDGGFFFAVSVGSNSTTLSVVTKANNRGGGFRCLVFLFGECGNVLCRSKFGACLVSRSKRWSFGHFVANIWSKFGAFFLLFLVWFGSVCYVFCLVQKCSCFARRIERKVVILLEKRWWWEE